MSFVLADARGFEVNTRKGTVTADMVDRPDTTIALRLTADELATLAKEFRASRLMAVPEPAPPYPVRADGLIVQQAPSTSWVFDLTLDGQHRRWSWSTARVADPSSTEWDALNHAVNRIRTMVQQRKEFLSLPPPNAFYQ